MAEYKKQQKSKFMAIILALLVGGLGVHRAYTGERGFCLLALFFWTGIPSIVALIDIIRYLTMSEETFFERFG